jgi:hypothetical protein
MSEKIRLYDSSGHSVTSALKATSGQIATTDSEGVEIARTYFTVRQPDGGTHQPDPARTGSAFGAGDLVDDTKGTWDVWVQEDGKYRLATTLADMLAALGTSDAPLAARREQVGTALTWSSMDAAPPGLREECEAFLDATKG